MRAKKTEQSCPSGYEVRMLKLFGRTNQTWDAESAVARITYNSSLPDPLRNSCFLAFIGECPRDLGAFLGAIRVDGATLGDSGVIQAGPEFSYLAEGDVVWF